MIYHALTIAMLFLAACSPMPGSWGLQPGIDRVHDLSEIEVREHPGTVPGTAATCNGIYWREGVAGKLGVILTLGMTGGCAVISGTEPGVIRWCDIWYPDGWERVRQHELQHCRGYADLF
jgi:hypothetical protein